VARVVAATEVAATAGVAKVAVDVAAGGVEGEVGVAVAKEAGARAEGGRAEVATEAAAMVVEMVEVPRVVAMVGVMAVATAETTVSEVWVVA
jgi:hypothetical protein